ncbi:MAG: FIST signal transduction protein [Solirubrobacteraceae bacterium]
MRIATGISTERHPGAAAHEAAGAAARGLGGERAELAVMFASGDHLADPEPLLAAVHAELEPEAVLGCGAGGVLADRRELESGTALAIWAAALEGGSARPFHAAAGEPDAGAPAGLPDLPANSALIMLCDPYSFAADAALEWLAGHAPGVPVLGGLASASGTGGEAVLFAGDAVLPGGAVGVCLEGVELLPCVSQGAAPMGPEMTITASEGNVIHQLAGRPALDAIERAVSALAPAQRALVASGLLIGIVIDGGKPEYEQGDFLVRGVLGADRDSGAVAVGTSVVPGQVVRLHARDARSADEDLRRALALRARAIGGQPAAGALVFSCNGRGATMFGERDHDAMAVADELHGAPAAGFFAAGEIGPVGGRSFLHGFTATVAVFPR